MKIHCSLAIITAVIMLGSCQPENMPYISSPSGNITVEISLDEQNRPQYSVRHNDTIVIRPSSLGFEFVNAPDLGENLEIKDVSKSRFHETWEMPWGEQRYVENNYNELRVLLRERTGLERYFYLVFRVYDDGLGFRYEFPEQPKLTEVLVANELTYFNLAGDHKCWWVPGDWDINEHLYSNTLFSQIDALKKRNHPNLAQSYIPVNAVNTPVTMRTENGLYLSFHEAALINYAGITLKVDPENLSMRSNLVGSRRTNYKVRQHTPFHTPWRTILIAREPGDLIESKLILNLNEPNQLGDVSWVKPTKYAGIWWEMHLDKSTWSFGNIQPDGTLKPHGRHGATTENAKYYIDFAARNNIGAVLIEGWNTGWENWIGTDDREGIFDFVTPYPDYDLEAVINYARERNVRIIMHHETSSAVTTYERQLDTAFALIRHLGIDLLKTGYVGTIIPEGEFHHGQWMVNHYMRVLEIAAQSRVGVKSHESIMQTGLRRTFPNEMAAENLRGQEFNAWAVDGGNPPGHLSIVAFTRMLAGPIDFTPGIFNLSLDPYRIENQVNTTLAHQLALYVVIYSPLQMVADLPRYYEGHPAFQFIKDVGVDWEQTEVLNGEIGQYVTIARQERYTGNWFVGSITNEDARELTISTDFLEPGVSYKTVIYQDAPDAHWDKNPTAYTIQEFSANEASQITLRLAPGGGAAISFIKQQ